MGKGFLWAILALVGLSGVVGCATSMPVQVTEFGGSGYVEGVTDDGKPAILKIESINVNTDDGVVPCVNLTLSMAGLKSSGTYESAPDLCRTRLGVFGTLEIAPPKANKGLDPN